MTILIKLGGSLITDKTKAKTFRPESVRQIARQVLRLREHFQGLRIIIGHGSGSFGHFEARKYRTAEGARTERERQGFVQVGAVAAELSMLVQGEFHAAGLPAMRFQPSSTIVASDKRIKSFDSRALALALDQQLIPLIHGDIALDETIGGTIISTEALFARLAEELDVQLIILLGEVEGALDHNGELIPRITPSSLSDVRSALTGSHGVDVTGGMLHKVQTMATLVRHRRALTVIIADGLRDNILVDLLIHRRELGTRICAEA